MVTLKKSEFRSLPLSHLLVAFGSCCSEMVSESCQRPTEVRYRHTSEGDIGLEHFPCVTQILFALFKFRRGSFFPKVRTHQYNFSSREYDVERGSWSALIASNRLSENQLHARNHARKENLQDWMSLQSTRCLHNSRLFRRVKSLLSRQLTSTNCIVPVVDSFTSEQGDDLWSVSYR